jgi:hypothetical protein
VALIFQDKPCSGLTITPTSSQTLSRDLFKHENRQDRRVYDEAATLVLAPSLQRTGREKFKQTGGWGYTSLCLDFSLYHQGEI